MSRREREHTAFLPVAIALFVVAATAAVALRVCYELLNWLSNLRWTK